MSVYRGFQLSEPARLRQCGNMHSDIITKHGWLGVGDGTGGCESSACNERIVGGGALQ